MSQFPSPAPDPDRPERVDQDQLRNEPQPHAPRGVGVYERPERRGAPLIVVVAIILLLVILVAGAILLWVV